MSRFNGLWNVWNGIASILVVFAGIFLTLGHIITAIIVCGVGISFSLVALHYELNGRFGKHSQYLAFVVGLCCWVVLLLLIPSDETSNEIAHYSPSTEAVRDSAPTSHLAKSEHSQDSLRPRPSEKKRLEKKNDTKQNTSEHFDVRSYNQHGGITVGRIQAENLSIRTDSPRRHLPKELIPWITQKLSDVERRPIIISSIMGDAEGRCFRDEIISVFKSSGWNADWVESVYGGHNEGIQWAINDTTDKSLRVIVEQLADIFRIAGFFNKTVYVNPESDTLALRIYSMP
jgi:hypothetical protein